MYLAFFLIKKIFNLIINYLLTNYKVSTCIIICGHSMGTAEQVVPPSSSVVITSVNGLHFQATVAEPDGNERGCPELHGAFGLFCFHHTLKCCCPFAAVN